MVQDKKTTKTKQKQNKTKVLLNAINQQHGIYLYAKGPYPYEQKH